MTDQDNNCFCFCPANQQDWRNWLTENHLLEKGVWLVYYKKNAPLSNISWSEAVDEALCFGWIDSIAKPIDDHTYRQFFCKRKSTSIWSRINKEKVKRLIEEGLMTASGQESIQTAKQNGSWKILDEVEDLVIPEDLEKAFVKHEGAKYFFLNLSRSRKKAMLQWLVLAKRPLTRENRINEIAALASQQLMPKQFV